MIFTRKKKAAAAKVFCVFVIMFEGFLGAQFLFV